MMRRVFFSRGDGREQSGCWSLARSHDALMAELRPAVSPTGLLFCSLVLNLEHHAGWFRVQHIPPRSSWASFRPDTVWSRSVVVPVNTHFWRRFMQSHLMTALLVTVSASVFAAGERLDSATPGHSDHSQPGSNADPPITDNADTAPAVPGRSYRDSAPPRYRIEQGTRGSSSAFPRVPGTSFKSYSPPSYKSR
jgi:hypothetical protein